MELRRPLSQLLRMRLELKPANDKFRLFAVRLTLIVHEPDIDTRVLTSYLRNGFGESVLLDNRPIVDCIGFQTRPTAAEHTIFLPDKECTVFSTPDGISQRTIFTGRLKANARHWSSSDMANFFIESFTLGAILSNSDISKFTVIIVLENQETIRDLERVNSWPR